ncbi:DNA translocase FtsK [Megalodesulfovibrio paquesii]
MLGLVWLLLACVLLLAVSTYSAQDPTFNQAVADDHVIQNGAGKLGSYLAGALHDLFGAGSFFLPVILLIVGLRQFLHQLAMPWWRWLGLGLLASTVMAVGGGGDWGLRHMGLGDMTGGGVFGRLFMRWSELLLTPVGASILWTLVFLASLQLLAGESFWHMIPRLHSWGQDQWEKHLERMLRREERRRRMEEGAGSAERQEFLFETLPSLGPVQDSWAGPESGPGVDAMPYPTLPPPPPPPPPGFAVAQSLSDAPFDIAAVSAEDFLLEADPVLQATPVYQPDAGNEPSRNIMDMICEEDETFADPIPDRESLAMLPANFSSIKEKFRQVLGENEQHAGARQEEIEDLDSDRPDAAAVTMQAVTVPTQPVRPVQPLQPAQPVQPVRPVQPVQITRPVPPPVMQVPVAPAPQPQAAPQAAAPAPAVQPQAQVDAAEDMADTYSMEEVAVYDRDLTLEEELAGPQTRQAEVAPVHETVLARSSLPPMQLLAPVPAQAHVVDPDELADQATRLTTCLADFNVQGDVHHVTPGPVVTMFEYKPAPGIKISRIANLSDDLALALKAMAVRIEAPIPGKDMVGVEIPSKVRETVFFREILESETFAQADSLLTLALGKDIAGASAVADLAKMPHLLVAGATGAGKSVCLNSILLSILYKARPDQVRMLLIDPKRIELAVYADLPHLVHPVVTEMALAKNALDWAVHEMDQRYQAMARVGARNIQGYNEKLAARRADGTAPDDWADLDHMPYLLLVIDELADLMLTAAKEVETSVVRLAQLARAAGIHMILATQRPSVDVVTGLIKANFPCRISFQVTSKHDSRTILDAVGAERLLGKGDMLYKPSGGKVKRLHGCFVSDDDVSRVVEFWKRQQPPSYQLDFSEWGENGGEEDGLSGGPGDLDTDPKYQEAKEFVLSQGKASISLIQRRFRIGFNRAARYVEQMEMDGIVGPADGAKPRPVLKG